MIGDGRSPLPIPHEISRWTCLRSSRPAVKPILSAGARWGAEWASVSWTGASCTGARWAGALWAIARSGKLLETAHADRAERETFGHSEH